VTLTRILRGQPISQGGRDHVSHRLVVLGLTEPQAVLCLYVMAAASGATALWIEKLSYTLSIALLPLVVLSCVLFTAYLSQVEILSPEEGYRRAMARRLPALFLTLTYKRRLLEVTLDFCLMAFAYYLALSCALTSSWMPPRQIDISPLSHHSDRHLHRVLCRGRLSWGVALHQS